LARFDLLTVVDLTYVNMLIYVYLPYRLISIKKAMLGGTW